MKYLLPTVMTFNAAALTAHVRLSFVGLDDRGGNPSIKQAQDTLIT